MHGHTSGPECVLVAANAEDATQPHASARLEAVQLVEREEALCVQGWPHGQIYLAGEG